MSYKEIRITFRPDDTVPFWDFPEEVKQHILETYDTPELRESFTKTFSEDGLTRTVKNTWKDRESFLAFCADPIIRSCFTARDTYNNDNDLFSFWQPEP
jgi:hypothetical protein